MTSNMIDTKNSYFKIVFKTREPKSKDDEKEMQIELEDAIDPILSKVGADKETYFIFNKKDPTKVICLLKTNKRKRLALLRNTIKKHIKTYSEEEFNLLKTDSDRFNYRYQASLVPKTKSVEALTKVKFNENIKKYKISESYSVKGEDLEKKYKGKDLLRFKNRDNWFTWQKKLYSTIFTDFGTFRDADEREIIFIEDLKGNAGKSKFLKFLYLKDPDNIGLLNEATCSQLKSTIVDVGEKRLYLIDLPRTKGEVGYEGLMAALEMLKNGMIQKNLYGDGSVLAMRPPFIVITGNRLPESGWSIDRWRIYSLIKTKKKTADGYPDFDWKDITKNKIKHVQEVIETNAAIEAEDLNLKKLKLQRIRKTVKKDLVL